MTIFKTSNAIQNTKHQNLLTNILVVDWKTKPLITIRVGDHQKSHTYFIKFYMRKFSKIPMKDLKNTLNEINSIVIRYSMAILLTKKRLENNQKPPTLANIP